MDFWEKQRAGKDGVVKFLEIGAMNGSLNLFQTHFLMKEKCLLVSKREPNTLGRRFYRQARNLSKNMRLT